MNFILMHVCPSERRIRRRFFHLVQIGALRSFDISRMFPRGCSRLNPMSMTFLVVRIRLTKP